jgi:hypothetical protein
MDEIGQVFIIDRRKDMMNTAGFKVFPTGCRMLKGSFGPLLLRANGAGCPQPAKADTASAANRWSTDFG